MKSTSHGMSMWRMRSERKNTAPLSTPTRTEVAALVVGARSPRPARARGAGGRRPGRGSRRSRGRASARSLERAGQPRPARAQAAAAAPRSPRRRARRRRPSRVRAGVAAVAVAGSPSPPPRRRRLGVGRPARAELGDRQVSTPSDPGGAGPPAESSNGAPGRRAHGGEQPTPARLGHRSGPGARRGRPQTAGHPSDDQQRRERTGPERHDPPPTGATARPRPPARGRHRRRRGGVGPNDPGAPSATPRGPRSRPALPWSARAPGSRRRGRRAGTGAPAASSASRRTTSRRSARAAAAEPAPARRVAARQDLVDQRVEHLGLVAQERSAVRTTLRLGRRVHGAQRRHQLVSHARARERSIVGRVLPPRPARARGSRRRSARA